MTIYEELIQRVEAGEPFRIDFEKRTMKVGKTKLIDNGEYDENRVLIGNRKLDMASIMTWIELLYEKYKYSLPSERSDKQRKYYFKALSIDELTDEQLMTAQRRELAQAKLEGFILCMILTGQFVWENISDGWFFQSKIDNDLVILKKWIK